MPASIFPNIANFVKIVNHQLHRTIPDTSVLDLHCLSQSKLCSTFSSYQLIRNISLMYTFCVLLCNLA